MSSQRGNVNRTRAQKHKNTTAYKNTKYDTSQRTKNILSVTQDGLCARCKEKIEWKIKYKKYKPLSQPATCTQCHEKTVKKAYYTVCQPCATSLHVCAKCAQKHDTVTQYEPDDQQQIREKIEMEQQIQMLSERERRSRYRLKAQCRPMEGLDSTDSNVPADDLDSVGKADTAAAAGHSDRISHDDEDDDDDGDVDNCGESVEDTVDAYTLFD